MVKAKLGNFVKRALEFFASHPELDITLASLSAMILYFFYYRRSKKELQQSDTSENSEMGNDWL